MQQEHYFNYITKLCLTTHGILHEAMPTNYAHVYEAYSIG